MHTKTNVGPAPLDRPGEKGNQQVTAQQVAHLRVEQRRRVCAETDRMFMWLMLLQWIAGIVVACIVSPRTWIGDTPHIHMHVYLAIFYGGLISVPPALLAWYYPGHRQTRTCIAVAQAAWSCLLIQLTGGRIETNFHAFGSLAFLAFYREWRLLIINSAIVLLDHVVRGYLWPMSIYSLAIDGTYRILEHAMWLIWINVFLVRSCIQQLAGERRSCERQAQLEHTNSVIEDRIQQRTRELADANEKLQSEFVEHRKTQQQREVAFRQLADASRRAGMAEVATGVLHNVGNVLNSVNVSANLLLSSNRKSRVAQLARASTIVNRQQERLAEFLTKDKQGKHFPSLLGQLTGELLSEQKQRQKELTSLLKNLDHIHRVIDSQQSFAGEKAVYEEVLVHELVEQALKITTSSENQKRFRIDKNFATISPIVVDRHKVLLVLVNLISNARHSLEDSGRTDGVIRISVNQENDTVRVHVAENGVGIAPENVDRIFEHRFTTKTDGHGFGLHSSALAAQALGGSLSVYSKGVGQGARFTLTFPVEKVGNTEGEVPCKR